MTFSFFFLNFYVCKTSDELVFGSSLWGRAELVRSVIFILRFVKSEKWIKLWITFFGVGCGIWYTYNKHMQTVFFTKLTKQGNSFGVIIPKLILDTYNWQRGDVFSFGFSGGDQISIKRITDLELARLKSNELPVIS